MTRWKREFRAWCDREGIRYRTIPKRWQDYGVAKVTTRLLDHEARKHEPEMTRQFTNLILYGTTHPQMLHEEGRNCD